MFDVEQVLRNFPKFLRRYQGFWKIYAVKLGIINYPIRLRSRNTSYSFLIRKRDRDIFDEFYFNDGYQDLKGNMVRFDQIVDIGAHIGLFSIEFSDYVEKVFSYEANPRTFELLQDNIRINGKENVNAENKAIHPQKKKLSLGMDSGVDSLEFDANDKKKLEVETMTLSEIVKGLPQGKKFLKMDCEGSEFPIIEKSSEEILRQFEEIFLE
jgi:FkbM family methyltransferase